MLLGVETASARSRSALSTNDLLSCTNLAKVNSCLYSSQDLWPLGTVADSKATEPNTKPKQKCSNVNIQRYVMVSVNQRVLLIVLND